MASPREIADERLASGDISQEEHADLVRRIESPTLLDPAPKPNDGGNWFYASGNEKKGPHSRDEMIALARSNMIAPETLVWTSGMADWKPLASLPLGAEISALLAPGAPPALPSSRARPEFGAPPIGAPGANSGYAPSASVGFTDAIRLAFQKYTDFSTRIGRPEFWYFVLFGVLGSWATVFLDTVLFGSSLDSLSPLNAIFSLALIIPSFSAGARRLHDIDRSGWWQLIMFVPLIGVIVLIVFWCTAGTRGRNRFG